MQNYLFFLLLFLLGCSSSKIDKSDRSDFSELEKQFDPVAWQKKHHPKKKKSSPDPVPRSEKRYVFNPNKYICIDKNGTGTDKRIIEYFPKEKSMKACRVEYTKFGKKTVPYSATETLKMCKVVFERIPRKLSKARYKCALEKIEVKRPAVQVVPKMKATVPAKKDNGVISKPVFCKSNKNAGDIRKVELIVMPNGGCIVEYTKFGAKKNVVEGAPGSKYCDIVYKRIPRKLKAAGFSCN